MSVRASFTAVTIVGVLFVVGCSQLKLQRREACK